MGQHWTNRIARPDVRFGSMLLKKSAARSSKATIESRRTGHWIDVASSTASLNQCCWRPASKTFFNSIGQNR